MIMCVDDFMLCKAENADPAHCLKEGRRVTRCAADLIEKMRASCAQTYDAHWQCLENNNQVRLYPIHLAPSEFIPLSEMRGWG